LEHDVEIHSAARKHGIDDASIEHAFNRAVVVADLEGGEAPRRELVVGPDRAGNMLELIVLQLDDAANSSSMPCRSGDAIAIYSRGRMGRCHDRQEATPNRRNVTRHPAH
jgi:hypothetical protein